MESGEVGEGKVSVDLLPWMPAADASSCCECSVDDASEELKQQKNSDEKIRF
jgi:hypothetical protein